MRIASSQHGFAELPLVRPAFATDLASVRDVLVETWHDTYDPIYGADRVTEITDDWHSLESLARGLRREGHAFLVAERGVEIVGTASATRVGGLITLNRLYVRPAHQGEGLGSALLDASLAQFQGAARIRLEVETHNTKGRSFYARRGFAELPERSDGGEGNVICEKPIATREGRCLRTLAIRPVRDDDAQDLFGLVTLCFAEFAGCVTDPHEDLVDLRAPASAIAARRGQFWVVEDGTGRVGGCVSVDHPTSGVTELHRVYLRPDLRGRGLADTLVALAEQEARAHGSERVKFWSDTRFLAAHRFYARLGYVRTGEERDLGDISNSREYRFQKKL